VTSDPPPTGRLVELREDECWDFLRSRHVGRLAWIDGGRPCIVPLNFTAYEDAVWVRTTAYSQLAREALGAQVAFEVDDVDAQTRGGTSVVVSGTAEPVEDLPDGWPGPDTWVEGTRTLLLRISADEVSGRRVAPR
jgi:uncharacterized protein